MGREGRDVYVSVSLALTAGECRAEAESPDQQARERCVKKSKKSQSRLACELRWVQDTNCLICQP